MFHQFVYLAVLAGALAGPLALSFDKKVSFYRLWPRLWPAITIPALVFIVWDAWFTRVGVWSFSDTYTLGIRMWGLPLEEWLFFLVVPYCSLFVYEVIKTYFPKAATGQWPPVMATALVLFFVLMAVTHTGELYTFWNFTFAAAMLILALTMKWFRPLLGFFLLAWVIGILPKLIVNGILTSLPVVSYNNAENVGIRIGTIPLEDFFYFFLLLLMNVVIFEAMKGRNRKGNPTG